MKTNIGVDINLKLLPATLLCLSEEPVDIASFDALPTMTDGLKLSHVTKARPKRVKAHAVTRPTAKPVNLVEDEGLQVPNTNSFFESKAVEGIPPKVQNVSKTDENENEKSSASRYCGHFVSSFGCQTDAVGWWHGFCCRIKSVHGRVGWMTGTKPADCCVN